MITRRLIPKLPDGCKVYGFLYDCDSRGELGEDMLDVVLPNGILITAGWFPDSDPNGQFCVSVFRGCEELIPTLTSRELDFAATDIERCASEFAGRNLQILSDSATTDSGKLYVGID